MKMSTLHKTFGERPLVKIDEAIPLVGAIAFGLIDRGTNVIQVRPISTCPLSCVFCSTNAGPKSRVRQTEYIVALDHLVEEFKRLVKLKESTESRRTLIPLATP